MKVIIRRSISLLILTTAWIAAVVPSWAVEPVPMEYFNSIVAGERHPGFRDGNFSSALFNAPEGLAVDDDASKLYVADSVNHRIRVVDLDDRNEVSTLAGSDNAGNADGTFETATFNHPSRILLLPPGDKLIVYDSYGGVIRSLDLKSKAVTTIATNITAHDMAYDPQANALFLTEPTFKKIVELDLKTGTQTTVVENDPQLTQPWALCYHEGKIHVSDFVTSKVFAVEIAVDPKDPKKISVNLRDVGHGDHILGMVSSDKTLYAIQAGLVGLVRIGQPTTPVSIATHWSFLADDSITGFQPITNFQQADIIGFAVCPKQARKFYLTRTYINAGGIISIKDYHYAEYWKAAGAPSAGKGDLAMDFDYPKEKPKGTYRIILAGDSRTNIAPSLEKGSDYGNGWFYGGDRMATMGKQLEFFLNSEAALRGVKIHFEVLEWNRAGHSLSSYAYYELPLLAQTYNVDMLLGLAGSPAFDNYFEEPINKDGIPGPDIDYEYILKPLSKRLASPIAKDLYERWKKTKGTMDTEKFAFPGQDDPTNFFCSADDAMKEDLVEMTGIRIKMAADKIASNNGAKTVLFYAPGFDLKDDCMSPFWAQLCKKYNFPLIDLTNGFNALRTAYYPVFTRCCSDHYTAYGDRMIGYMVCHYLIEDHLIPFDPEKDALSKP